MKIDVVSMEGKKVGELELADAVFGTKVKDYLLWEVVKMQQAAKRAGTHQTKTREFVRGGGRKPYKQKGTGNARQGSTRSPHWQGGGVALRPKPRTYRQRTPKKMIKLALRSALSDRAAEGKVLVLDEWGITEPRTKDAIELMKTLGLRTPGERDARVLLVLERDEEAVWKSFRNLGERVQIVIPDELNTYDVLVNDWLVFSKATLASAVARFGGTAEGSDGSATSDDDVVERSDDAEAGDEHGRTRTRATSSSSRSCRRSRTRPTTRTSTRSSSPVTPTRSRSATRWSRSSA